jgi:hypothetical protein
MASDGASSMTGTIVNLSMGSLDDQFHGANDRADNSTRNRLRSAVTGRVPHERFRALATPDSARR